MYGSAEEQLELGKDVLCHPNFFNIIRKRIMSDAVEHHDVKIIIGIFIERITFDTLQEHDGKVSIDGTNVTNQRFADHKNGLAEILEALFESLSTTCTMFKMEISTEKKTDDNNTNAIQV